MHMEWILFEKKTMIQSPFAPETNNGKRTHQTHQEAKPSSNHHKLVEDDILYLTWQKSGGDLTFKLSSILWRLTVGDEHTSSHPFPPTHVPQPPGDRYHLPRPLLRPQ